MRIDVNYYHPEGIRDASNKSIVGIIPIPLFCFANQSREGMYGKIAKGEENERHMCIGLY